MPICHVARCLHPNVQPPAPCRHCCCRRFASTQGAHFDHIHVASAFTKLAQLVAGPAAADAGGGAAGGRSVLRDARGASGSDEGSRLRQRHGPKGDRQASSLGPVQVTASLLCDLLLEEPRLSASDGRCFATALWALAKVDAALAVAQPSRQRAARSARAVADAASRRLLAENGVLLAEAAPQALANLAWACGKLGVGDGALWDGIAAAAAPRAEQFSHTGLTNLLYGFAAGGVRNHDLLSAAVPEAARRFGARREGSGHLDRGRLQPDHGTASADGRAANGYDSQRRGGSANERSSDEAQGELQDQQATSLLWSAAKLGVADADLFIEGQRKVGCRSLACCTTIVGLCFSDAVIVLHRESQYSVSCSCATMQHRRGCVAAWRPAIMHHISSSACSFADAAAHDLLFPHKTGYRSSAATTG